MNFIENIWWIALGLVVGMVLTIVIRLFLGRGTKKEKTDDESSWIVRFAKRIGNFVLAVCSLDYHLAKIQKMPLKKEIERIEKSDDAQKEELSLAKGKLANYIESANILNLISTLGLAIVAFIALAVKCDVFTYITFGVLCYRTLSRTIEVDVSFVKDICTRVANKKSNLDKYDRIKLAIKSLIEEALLFAAMYAFLIKGDCNILQCLIGGLHSFTIDVYAAESVQVWSGEWFKFVAVWQKVCSGILITLCIAQYFAGDDKKQKFDDNKTNTPGTPAP